MSISLCVELSRTENVYPSPKTKSCSYRLYSCTGRKTTGKQYLYLNSIQWPKIYQPRACDLFISTLVLKNSIVMYSNAPPPPHTMKSIPSPLTWREICVEVTEHYYTPTTRTHFADRAFRCTAPTVWRSLDSYTVDSGSVAVFKSRLNTFLFRRTFHPV